MLADVQVYSIPNTSATFLTAKVALCPAIEAIKAHILATKNLGKLSTILQNDAGLADTSKRKSTDCPISLTQTKYFLGLRSELQNLGQLYFERLKGKELFSAEQQCLYYPEGGACFGHLDGEQLTNHGQLVQPVRGRAATSLIYLNSCDGGELYFGKNKEVLIKPEKGLLVFWPNTWEHYHGVNTNLTERYLISCFWSAI